MMEIDIVSPYGEVVRQMLASNPEERIQLDCALTRLIEKMNNVTLYKFQFIFEILYSEL